MSKRRDAGGVQHSTGYRRPKTEPSILDKAGYWERWQTLKEFLGMRFESLGPDRDPQREAFGDDWRAWMLQKMEELE